MFIATPNSTAATRVRLASLLASGSANSARNMRSWKIASARHLTSCDAMSDCEDRRNHVTVSQAYPKHQIMRGDFRRSDMTCCLVSNGNDTRQNKITH